MLWKDYIVLALRTEVRKTETTLVDRVNHAVLGLVTEHAELLVPSYHPDMTLLEYQIAELGDTGWYIAVLCDAVGYYEEPIPQFGPNGWSTRFTGDKSVDWPTMFNYQIARIANNVKRTLYGKQNGALDMDTLREDTAVLLGMFQHYAAAVWATVLERNIAKLRFRHRDAASVQVETTRNLAGEAEVMRSIP